jgi:16S rRNA (guanine527-N7)-methyltransferase
MFHGEHIIQDRNQDPEQDPEQVLEATRTTLADGLEALRLHPGHASTDKLARLAVLLADWAPKMNLTGHRGADAIARRLILDAVALFNVLPDFDSLADLGSGAGFPGLPIAILYPDRRLVSVEARAKRVSFQRAVVRKLGLENVEIIQSRIENVEPVVCQAVVAQAVVPPDQIAPLLLPWCRSDGWIAAPGTPESLAEIPPETAGTEPGEIRRYQVPLAGSDRRVWLTRPAALNPAPNTD